MGIAMPHDNKQHTRDWFDQVWNQRRGDVIAQMVTPDVVVHGLGDDRIGADAFREFHRTFLGAFPDLTVEVNEVIGDGDVTAARFTVRGTHQGDHLGFNATGKPLLTTGMAWVRWRDGRIVEGWNEFDSAGKITAMRNSL
jgi:steroid delta-isomerase-like uncharacterized protein